MRHVLRNPDVAQEDDRLSWGAILLIFSLMTLVGIFLVVWAWYGLQKHEQALRPSLTFPERELGPRRTVSRVLESLYGEVGPGQMLNEQKKREITSFAWVDRQRRLVTIPIDDAMSLLVGEEQP
jgi:hypothetical protein